MSDTIKELNKMIKDKSLPDSMRKELEKKRAMLLKNKTITK